MRDRGRPPESVDDSPITLDAASRLMADLGFVLFRTPPEAEVPDSCLMAAIHASPTRRHFDPEIISFWTTLKGRGQLTFVDRDLRVPFEGSFSWGRIRMVDRLGARNSFVSFGGVVTADRVAADALLVVLRSPAPIFRLPGHSQREDRLAEEVMSFFGRLVPALWPTPDAEEAAAMAPPRALYAAFLLHTTGRLEHSSLLRDALGTEASRARQAMAQLAREDPGAVADGHELLRILGLASVG